MKVFLFTTVRLEETKETRYREAYSVKLIGAKCAHRPVSLPSSGGLL